MKRIFSLAILLGSLTACVAQNATQQTLDVQQSAAPASTIVPIIQPTYGVRDTLTRATPEAPLTHTGRRAKLAHDYAFKIDSLIATRAYAFYPTLMQAVPSGEMKQIYADYFYAYVKYDYYEKKLLKSKPLFADLLAKAKELGVDDAESKELFTLTNTQKPDIF